MYETDRQPICGAYKKIEAAFTAKEWIDMRKTRGLGIRTKILSLERCLL